ncbi:uncharacterized protein MELLADRAFT_86554 [Melampsora larici-populina 98AG31]|uniref:Polynucleotide 5'-hydroxyl-kinase GRC3 n=1 Tax=Melampsora larici-populina (strain 98AG31 / pathotype 3-4-7) TaxID=747676 RepID=F4RM77_MELLP|nr:uncharacterized protein MELLADRAFT_86554 [Melampsora larici-populina 98AG31]EGG06374.1 hypothetical protein MELLADRAFT_86554 [Melampsora larici-populina 98AG31]
MGTIEINGARIKAEETNEPTEIFAPISHPLPILTTLKSTSSPSAIIQPETGLNESNFDAIIEIQDFHTGIEGIDLVWSSNEPKRPIWNHSSSKQPLETSVYGITWDIILTLTADISSIKLPKTWSNSLSNQPSSNPTTTTKSNECYLVQGPKGVGKSTFLRLLLNKLLQSYEQVAILDLDPGQPLFTSPSLISLNLINQPLIGPSFCFQSILQSSLRSYYLGNISPIDSPQRYLERLEDLINFYKLEFHEFNNLEPVLLTKRQRRKYEESLNHQVDSIQVKSTGKCSDRVPLLVNTMGWTTGLGSELLSKIRELVNPSTIFTFESQETFQANENNEENPSIQYLEPIGDTPLSLRLPSNESRTLNLISYLYSSNSTPISQTDRNTKFFRKWDFENQLYKQRPMIINHKELSIDLFEEEIPESHLSYVLNGSIVAILSNHHESNCLGLGLVRSFDQSHGILYLILPEGFGSNDEKFKICKGFEPCLPLNLLVYEHEDHQIKPYLEIRNLGIGHSNLLVGFEKKRVRRNVMRWSQRGN